MTDQRRPNVFSIAPGVPFLTTLVSSVRSGAFDWPGPDPSNPLALASTTIYVPTRRAARALRALFAETGGTRSAILPVIKPLGEFDEDAAFFASPDAEELSLDPPIASDERILTLARLTSAWSKQLGHDAPSLIAGENIMLPSTAADAIWLARDLAGLMDEMEREGVTWHELAKVDSDALAGWWQHTVKFLSIVTEAFPAYLAERGLSDPVAHRNAVLRAEARRLSDFPPAGPVIAAGSTGSIPATADLLAVIARLPQGAVVLPGLDKQMDEATWAHIGAIDAPASICGHPQFGLMKLLSKLGAMRADVQPLTEPARHLQAREKIISEALRPADTTDLWGASAGNHGEALSDVVLIEAPGEREEALAIAIALRQALGENREHTAALVTPDRNLARRVSAELLRFGIVADDSGGTPLANTPQAALFQTLIRCVFAPAGPVDLLTVLKHPLSKFGRESAVSLRAAETLELVALRGNIGEVDAQTLGDRFERSLLEAAERSRRADWMDRVSGADIEAARQIAKSFRDALAPLQALAAAPHVSVPEAVHAAVAAFEMIGCDAEGSLAALYDGDHGEAFAAHLRGLVSAETGFVFSPEAFPDVHSALIAGKAVKPKTGSDPNIFIWGSLEARLQEVDTIVLGSLNEGSWPGAMPEDPFLSRGMKSSMRLDPPERRIGQAAHDFQMAMGTAKVILTRSLKSDSAPSVASRWLQRLTAFIGKTDTEAMRARGAQYLHWATEIDALPNMDLERRPEPSPPAELRPRHFSITEIATLRSDPYSIHAKRILKLLPLDPLIRVADERERGTLFHAIMAQFIETRIDLSNEEKACRALRRIALMSFEEQQYPFEVLALWQPRFDELVEGIVQMERLRGDDIKASHTEISAARTQIPNSSVTISGRADRIDERHDGMVDIIDYKTGTAPTVSQARALVDPQLALEAALTGRGAFNGIAAANVNDLAYYRLKSKGELHLDSLVHANKGVPAEELAEKSWRELTRLIGYFAKPDAKYSSHVLPPKKQGDYDHLSRLLEWSAGSDDSEAPADE